MKNKLKQQKEWGNIWVLLAYKKINILMSKNKSLVMLVIHTQWIWMKTQLS